MAAFVAGNSMVYTLAVNLSELDETERVWAHLVLLLTALIVFALVGMRLVQDTFRAVLRKQFATECLFVSGIVGAFAVSSVSLWRREGPVYFEVMSLLLVIYGWGQQLKRVMQAGVEKSLLQAIPLRKSCRLIDAKGEASTGNVRDLEVGQVVEVRPGEKIPIDGEIVSGESFVNEASLTGEGVCVSRTVGAQVKAGMVLVDAVLRVRATTRGSERDIDMTLENVRNGLLGKSAIESQVTRLGRFFFPVVAIAACLTFVVWALLGSAFAGFLNAMSVLLVACPCALGFATPTALWASVIGLARLGFVTKNNAVVESLAQATTFVFDKTGTLTDVAANVSSWSFVSSSKEAQDDIKALAGLAQQSSTHPFAKAFSLDVQWSQQSPWRPIETRILPGRGIEVDFEGPKSRVRLKIGDGPKLVEKEQTLQYQTLASILAEHQRPLAVFLDDALVAVVGVEDLALSSADALLQSLTKNQTKVCVFSGDALARVSLFSAPYLRANMLAEDKRQAILEMQASGEIVCFVGDGVNDASAMAQSEVGIAIASGSSLACAAGDLLVNQEDLCFLPKARLLAQRTMYIIQSNLRIALVYNIIAMTVAASGFLHPAFAAVVMLLSSLGVTLRSATLAEGSY